jgi:hypothetical protein
VTALLNTMSPAVVGDATTITWLTPDGTEERFPLTEAWSVRFEDGMPVRRFRSRKGQRHLSGLWWSATVGRHVGFESWLERDHVMLLDFDPRVVGIGSQPFRLSWRDEAGAAVAHCPDFFARREVGAPVVIGCRPVERRPEKDGTKFDVTAAICPGWGVNQRERQHVHPVEGDATADPAEAAVGNVLRHW